jgi:hypothetical protein
MLSIIDLLGRPSQDAIAFLGPCWSDPNEEKEEGPDQRVYLEFREKGVSLILNEEATIFCIQLYGEGCAEDYSCFHGILLGGLQLSSGCAEVRGALGEPLSSAQGAAGKGLFGRYLYAWDKYEIDFCEYHFEYNESLDHLRLISIESAAIGGAGGLGLTDSQICTYAPMIPKF